MEKDRYDCNAHSIKEQRSCENYEASGDDDDICSFYGEPCGSCSWPLTMEEMIKKIKDRIKEEQDGRN